ncbi:MAG: class I SAM-dependent methyltransferase [Thalassobaculales bacterium]
MLTLKDTRASYKRIAYLYDVFENAIFDEGRKIAADLVNAKPRQRILDVGCGTGLALPLFRRDADVVGIDASPDMLRRAQRRVVRKRLGNVVGLVEMDALNMAFPDDSFDAVLGMHIASVVADPFRLIAEMKRVCRPDGDIILVNHFASKKGVMRLIERACMPFGEVIGFHPDIRMRNLISGAGLHVAQVKRVNLGGYWRLIHFVNRPAAAEEGASVAA